MTMELIKTRFVDGIWEGRLTGPDAPPVLNVHHHGQPLNRPQVTQHPEAGWIVKITLPTQVLGDGVQTVVITEDASGEQLGAIHVMAGEALDDDLRAEVQLLREELDMLKRAFRRHCVETA